MNAALIPTPAKVALAVKVAPILPYVAALAITAGLLNYFLVSTSFKYERRKLEEDEYFG